ncbi:hypothetical protein BV20DRAFT_959202 [Pilatotrama ljubarskyi]|nr:hypothetical protein BV20DRAFT_959202 [Pilatotrama ljubarskyi]
MYQDKCFQLEPLFPLVALNHEQIKGATTGGYLLADKSKFVEIANCLLNIITIYKKSCHLVHFCFCASKIMAYAGAVHTPSANLYTAPCTQIHGEDTVLGLQRGYKDRFCAHRCDNFYAKGNG